MFLKHKELYLAAVVVLLTSMALSCSGRGDADDSYNRGNAYAGKGEYDKAIAEYTEAIRLDPTLAQAYYNRGFAYLNKGDYDKAIAEFTEAIRLHPQNPSFYLSRAKVYRALGDDVKAAEDEGRARELSK